MKFLMTLCFFPVLLQLGYADVDCFLNKVEGITPLHQIVMGVGPACKNSAFDDQRQTLKICKIDDKVNLDNLEDTLKAECTENTEFNKDFEESFHCIYPRQIENPCMPYIDSEKSPKKRLTELCRKREEYYTCTINKWGKPCGEDGLRVIKRATKSIESYLKGLCYLVGRATLSAISMWNILPCVLFTLAVWL